MNTIFDNFTGEVNLDIFRPSSEIPGASLRRQYLSLVGLLQYVDIINGDLTGTLPANITEQTVKGMIAHCIGDLKVREEMSKEPIPVEQPDDEIWYTSSDGNIIEPYGSFGANIISNTYEKGKGIIKFDGPVTEIGTEAFSNMSIKSISIPNSVTSIGEYAFGECDWLTSIEIGLGVKNIDDNAFFATGLKSLVIPDNVVSIGAGVCYRCGDLISITIGAGVESFGDIDGFAYFGQCDNLESITVDQNNTVYDSRDNCNAIVETSTNTLIAGCKNTIIPDSVTSIGTMAFSECFKLSSIIIPDSVISIGDSAFDQCSDLFSITSLNTTPPTIGSNVFNNDTGDQQIKEFTIYVPADYVDAYKTAWSEYADYIQAIAEDNNEPEEEPGE